MKDYSRPGYTSAHYFDQRLDVFFMIYLDGILDLYWGLYLRQDSAIEWVSLSQWFWMYASHLSISFISKLRLEIIYQLPIVIGELFIMEIDGGTEVGFDSCEEV